MTTKNNPEATAEAVAATLEIDGYLIEKCGIAFSVHESEPIREIIDRHFATLRAQVEAAKALVAKLNSLPEDGRYMAVWSCYQNHGGKYTGPFYVDELKELENELARLAAAGVKTT
jgi:hypothetical protein